MTTQEGPRNLDELRAVAGAFEQVQAATAYLGRVGNAAREARKVRDQAVRQLIASHGPSKTAEMVGMSLTTIKAIGRER